MTDIKQQTFDIKDKSSDQYAILLEYNKKGSILYGTPHNTGKPYKLLVSIWDESKNDEIKIYEEVYVSKKAALKEYMIWLKKIKKVVKKRNKK